MVHQLHKRIAQAAPRLGLRALFPPWGCVSSWKKLSYSLVRGVWPLLSFLPWIGEVPGLLVVDASLPLSKPFWKSKTGEEGWQSRPLSPWADGVREAMLRWAGAKGL